MNVYKYLTVWSLIISYSIFIWGAILPLPKWLFLYAACILTTTSIMGTFFITMPDAGNKSQNDNISTQMVVLQDAFVHSGPLILFLCLFRIIARNVVVGEYNIIRDSYKILLVTFVMALAYLINVQFVDIYSYNYFVLIILSVSVFIVSYQIYGVNI